MENKKQRNVGVDLLRCVVMYFICLLHIVGAGGIAISASGSQRIISYMIEAITLCSVNCYAMISGFVSTDKALRFKKLVFMWVEVVFWLVVTSLLAQRWFPDDMPENISIALCFLPLTNAYFWYFNAYCILFLFIPILNCGLEIISQKQYKRILCLLCAGICFFSVIPRSDIFVFQGGYSGIWLIVLYVFGAYFRLYEFPKWGKWWILLLGFLVSAGMVLLFGLKISASDNYVYPNLVTYTSPFLVFMAFCLLGMFSRIQIRGKPARIISLMGRCTFGVYIIHVSPVVWSICFNGGFSNIASMTPLKMTSAILVIACGLFAGCLLLSIARYFVFQRTKINWLIEKLCDTVHSLVCSAVTPRS